MDRRTGVTLATGLVGLLAASGTARAHVDYVVDGGDAVQALSWIARVLSAPANAALVVGTGLAAVVTAAAYLRYRPAAPDVAVFRATMAEYRDLLPWLLRLSMGLPLVGAGFAGYYFSPAVQVEARILQVGVGFLLLFGLATRVAALAGVGAYLLGLAVDPAILLANEFVGGLLAVALVGSGRPSADQVLQRIADAPGTLYGEVDPVHRGAAWLNRAVEPYERYLPTLLRATLGVDFVYLGVTQKLLDPGPALAVVDRYDLAAVVPVDPELWVVGAGLAEVAVGTALLLGLFTRASAMVALVLFVSTLFGLPDDPVLAHVTLFGLASALLVTGSGPIALDRWLGTASREGSAPEASAAPDASD